MGRPGPRGTDTNRRVRLKLHELCSSEDFIPTATHGANFG